MKKPVWIIIGIIVVVLIVVGVSKKFTSKTATNQPIKIGGLFAQVGYAAFAGEASKNGFLLAIKDSGMNVDYVVEDTQSDVKTAVSAATKLINVDKVSVVIGPEWAEFSEVILPLANANKVPFISPWMASEAPWLGSRYYFSPYPSERGDMGVIVKDWQKKNIKTTTLVYSQNSWSIGVVAILKDVIAKQYPSLVVKEVVLSDDSKDYRTDILKLKNQNQGAVFLALGSDAGAGLFLRQMKESQVSIPAYTPFGRGDFLVKNASAATLPAEVYYPAPKDYPRMAEFKTKYKAAYGIEPSAVSAAIAYDATTLVVQAIKNGAKNSEEIIDYLKRVKNYSGYSSVIQFNDKNTLDPQPSELRRIKGASYEVVP